MEKPWTKWTFHLNGALNASPFPDAATFAKKLPTSFSNPDDCLSAMASTLELLSKERAMTDKMLAGGTPY